MSYLINTRNCRLGLVLTASVLLGQVHLFAQTTSTAPGVDHEALQHQVATATSKALKYLENAQASDGRWHQQGSPDAIDVGVTGLVLKAFLQDPRYGPQHPVSRRALDFILRNQQPDGGIYTPKSLYSNYTTSVGLMALASAGNAALKPKIAAAQEWLADNQWDEGERGSKGEAIDPSHPWYGGAGYGNEKRPDLSNTQMMLEALHQSGLPPTHPVYQKALKFISRSQMLSQTNDQAFARGAEDGGFIYSPANGGESKAGTWDVNGRKMLRSYGSMTYAGFKSMLYANVDRNDPRVKAAWEWIRRYYSLEENPNMPGAHSKEGLFYYYHVFAKALEAWGSSEVVDTKGTSHDWRVELAQHLLQQQAPDGSWVNNKDRWQEGNPYLVTAYAVLALQTTVR